MKTTFEPNKVEQPIYYWEDLHSEEFIGRKFKTNQSKERIFIPVKDKTKVRIIVFDLLGNRPALVEIESGWNQPFYEVYGKVILD